MLYTGQVPASLSLSRWIKEMGAERLWARVTENRENQGACNSYSGGSGHRIIRLDLVRGQKCLASAWGERRGGFSLGPHPGSRPAEVAGGTATALLLALLPSCPHTLRSPSPPPSGGLGLAFSPSGKRAQPRPHLPLVALLGGGVCGFQRRVRDAYTGFLEAHSALSLAHAPNTHPPPHCLIALF